MEGLQGTSSTDTYPPMINISFMRLQSILEKCLRKHITILMRDLDDKVETDNTGYECTME